MFTVCMMPLMDFLNKASKERHYLTSIPAFNYHHYDWHKCSVDYNRKYPDEVKTWCSWGIEDNIASPIRVYLDLLTLLQ